MNRIQLIIISLLYCFSSAAQPAGVNALVTGAVINGSDKKPVAGVTISLSVNTGEPIHKVLSAANGNFSLAVKDTGEHLVTFSHVGFRQQTLKLSVGADFKGWHIGTVTLQPGSGVLPEIVITTNRPLVEQKADRLVYNAEKDLSTLGGTAADVLRNVPMLSVDGDGSVQLRGSSNIRVLINNRPSTLLAASVADALRQMPADMIRSVEVITSPTARYDAEGSAGIINIITKKNLLQGVTGSVLIVPGNVSTIGNGSLYFRRPRYGFNFSFGINQFYNRGKTYLERLRYSDESVLTQDGRTRNRSGFVTPRFGFDVTLSNRSSVSGGVSYNPSHANTRNRQHINAQIPGYQPDDRNMLFLSKSRGAGYDANLDYLLTFKEPQREFSVLTLYSVARADNLASQNEWGQSDEIIYLQRNKNKSTNREATIQADYTHPFQNKTTIELGAKTILRRASSDVSYYDAYPPVGNEHYAENIFSYDQNVWAAYMLYGFKAWQKLQVKMGGRYERTAINATFKTLDMNFKAGYDNWIPSLNAAYSLSEKKSLRFGYTQRLQRPQLYFLNPYREVIAPGVIRQGNPELDAELTHLLEVGYNTYTGKGSLNMSVYARFTNNAIATAMELHDDTTYIGFQNIAVNKTYGFSVSGNIKPVKRVTVNSNMNIYYTRLNGDGFSNDGWMYNLFVGTSIDLGKGWWHNFVGSFNSRRVILQGRMAAFYYHNTTLRKDFKNKRGSIGINIANPFMKGTRMRTSVMTALFEQNENNINYTRGFRISFQYRFGKLQQSKDPRKAKKIINNDDALRGQ
ncbi:MAG: TonB-dependent receptor [Chitinophagaceae bacterium]